MEKKSGAWMKNAWLVAGSIGYNCLVYYGTKLVNESRLHTVTCGADGTIPLVPWTVFIYLTFFGFWAVNYFLALELGKEGKRLLLAHVLGETVCLAVFLAYPSVMPRPELTGGTLAQWVLGLVYWVDVPTNVFPSIHCMVSTLGWLGVRRVESLPKWYRWGAFALGAGICISTLTVKQHALADLVSGIGLALVCYWAAGRVLQQQKGRAFT